jgi:UrcA family protein
MKAIGIAILAAGILAGSTGASAAPREKVAFTVNTAGVDFANAESVGAFRRDLERRIAAVCNPGDRMNADMSPDFKCRKELASTMEPSIQQLVARATDRRFAAN